MTRNPAPIRGRERLRNRILTATADELCARGWDALTVASVARRAKVRRQGIYEEIGTKVDLGRALVEREVSVHLAAIERRLRTARTPTDALAAAAETVLRDTARDRLVVAALGTGSSPPEPELLVWVASAAGTVLAPSVAALTAALTTTFPSLDPDLAALACEVVTRLTLSHLLLPHGTVEDAVAEVRAVADLLLESRR